MIAASFVLIALLAGIAGTTWGLLREAHHKTRLAQSLDREQKANTDLSVAHAKVEARYDLAVDAIKTFHTGVSEDFLLREEKFKDLRNRLLKSASDFYGKLVALLGKETDFASRRALAESNFELAELTRKVGRSEDALAAHRAVLAAREAIAAEPTADAAAKTDVGRSLTAVAFVLSSTTKTVEAIETFRRSESLLAGLGDLDPTVRNAIAACRSRMARALLTLGKQSEALAVLKRAVAEQKVLTEGPHASNETRRDLARTAGELGLLLFNTGKPADAEPEMRRAAIAILQKLTDENNGVPEYENLLANTQMHLGFVLLHKGEAKAAEIELRSALAVHRKLADGNPAVRIFHGNVALGRMFLGRVLLVTGKPEATQEILSALATTQKLVDEDPEDAGFRNWLALLHNYLGVAKWQMGKPDEAEAECRTALAIQQKLADESPAAAFFRDRLAYCFIYLGDVVRSLGRTAEAKGLYERAIALREEEVRADGTNLEHRYALVCAIRRRGMARRDLGDPVGAAADLRGRWRCPTGCRRGRHGSYSRSRWYAATRRLRSWPVRPDRGSRRPKERRRLPGRWNGWAGPLPAAIGMRTSCGSSRPLTRCATAPTSRSCSPSWRSRQRQRMRRNDVEWCRRISRHP